MNLAADARKFWKVAKGGVRKSAPPTSAIVTTGSNRTADVISTRNARGRWVFRSLARIGVRKSSTRLREWRVKRGKEGRRRQVEENMHGACSRRLCITLPLPTPPRRFPFVLPP